MLGDTAQRSYASGDKASEERPDVSSGDDSDKARVRAAFDMAAAGFDDPAVAFWERFGRRTVERLDPQPGWRVLDAGCGTGTTALPAAGRVGPQGRVVAVDFADEMIVRARRKAAARDLGNVDFRVADVTGLALPEGAFDAVICSFNLFALPDMVGLARRFHALLRPGGRLAVTTWGAQVLEPLHGIWQEALRRDAPEHFRARPRWQEIAEPLALARLLAEAGFPETSVVEEQDRHPFDAGRDADAFIAGSTFGWTLAQLAPETARRLRDSVFDRLRQAEAAALDSEVLYAVAIK